MSAVYVPRFIISEPGICSARTRYACWQDRCESQVVPRFVIAVMSLPELFPGAPEALTGDPMDLLNFHRRASAKFRTLSNVCGVRTTIYYLRAWHLFCSNRIRSEERRVGKECR